MAKFGYKKNINIGRVVGKIAGTIIALWVGGTILTEIGNVMNGTCSPFYRGLSLIGWTVGAGTAGTTGCPATNTNTITATTGSGVLAVIGIIGIASIVMEFVTFKM